MSETLQITVDGRVYVLPRNQSLLDVLRRASVPVPTLCHDDRLKPEGSCRLCLVQVEGHDRFVPACSTMVEDGMVIRATGPDVERARSQTLEFLANSCRTQTPERFAGSDFAQLLDEHQLTIPRVDAAHPMDAFCVDDVHPYIRVDMSLCIYCNRCVRICDEVQGQMVWKTFGRGHHIRIWPDDEKTLLESSCVSCGACADTCPTGAIIDRTIFASERPSAWVKTTCPYCGVGCQMNAGTDKTGKLVQVLPSADSPVNKGHLCVKGRYAWEFAYAPDRITSPMIRRSGVWETVDWPEALGFVAARFAEIRDAHGSERVGVLGSARATNEENYLAQKFARVVLGTNNVDSCARVCHAPSAAALRYMLGTGAATSSFEDIEVARTILICGTNTTENHPIVGARIKQAVRRGARLIVIDPRRIELVDLPCTHLALKPGTNVPLLNAMAHVIVHEGLVDTAFVAARCRGFEELSEFLKDQTPEWAESQSGVPADQIREAARTYATMRPSIAFHGLGLAEHVQGTEGVECLINLALLSGNVGRPGTGVNPLRGQNNVQGAAHMGCEPNGLTGLVSIREGRETFETVWGARIPEVPGLNLLQMLDASERSDFKALWVMGYDVALSNPNAERSLEALRQIEFVVIQDMFMTETAARFGSVFLPVAGPLEKDGTFMNSERRVQRIRRVIPAPDGCRTDWEILCDVAGRMGHEDAFRFDSAESIWEEIRKVWPAGAGITYSRLEAGGLQWPCPSIDHPGTTLLHQGSFAKDETAMLQRIAYRPTAEQTSAHYPFLLITGRTLHQFNAGTMTMRTPSRLLRPADTLDIHPQDAAQLDIADGDRVQIESRYGRTELPARVTESVAEGQVFATFHTVESFVNRVTSSERDSRTSTPEYKVTAVRVVKIRT